jgi:uncharacterized alpha-E superfamily protein
MQIGTFLERLDGVSRLLQVRLACEDDATDGEPVTHDYLPWTVLLRALSAYEIFRRVSRDAVSPHTVVHFTAFRADVPRSLLRSAQLVHENLEAVANSQSAETQRRAGLLHSMLRFGTLETLGVAGAAGLLRDVLARGVDLGDRIGLDFLGHAAS